MECDIVLTLNANKIQSTYYVDCNSLPARSPLSPRYAISVSDLKYLYLERAVDQLGDSEFKLAVHVDSCQVAFARGVRLGIRIYIYICVPRHLMTPFEVLENDRKAISVRNELLRCFVFWMLSSTRRVMPLIRQSYLGWWWRHFDARGWKWFSWFKLCPLLYVLWDRFAFVPISFSICKLYFFVFFMYY